MPLIFKPANFMPVSFCWVYTSTSQKMSPTKGWLYPPQNGWYIMIYLYLCIYICTQKCNPTKDGCMMSLGILLTLHTPLTNLWVCSGSNHFGIRTRGMKCFIYIYIYTYIYICTYSFAVFQFSRIFALYICIHVYVIFFIFILYTICFIYVYSVFMFI